MALALCEGPILRVGRVWADGVEIGADEIGLRVYPGTEDQLPDPKIEAVQGAGMAPAYRGTAYVVIEDLMLDRFGNRVPQFSFEVLRAAAPPEGVPGGLAQVVKGVALIPGSGEYAVATTPVTYRDGPGQYRSANRNAPGARTDFAHAIEALAEELPAVRSTLFVVCWFGDDLRCGRCRIRPKVEFRGQDGEEMPWSVAGRTRAEAEEVPRVDGRPVYGGTPADAAVIEAIRAQRAAGLGVVFVPFVLMDQLAGNGLADPWGGAEQAALPWRGRITGSVAPGRPGTVDGTAAADAEVAAFFDGEGGYRAYVLHCARLCVQAGGVAAFCLGSELVGLTRLRGADGGFPAVTALRRLAAEVRAILGPGCRIGYAADWTEYGGYRTPDGDLRFPLDPLWSDPEIDFVGIDWYPPLSDWRDGEGHADAGWGTIHDAAYLAANVEGGEHHDWFYADAADRAAQRRSPIEDGAGGEAWVWRAKDIRSWWANPHHERRGGLRQALPTGWVPAGKPVWLTEIGCPAVEKGTNAPNLFIDPKSSESGLPPFSDGTRDDLIQHQALRVLLDYWEMPGRNPVSPVYGGAMIDTARSHVWAYDTRPWPRFPQDLDLWSDGANHARGHWLNGRTVLQPLAAVVPEICAAAGLTDVDVTGLRGLVRGYTLSGVATARAALQPLMLAYGFDAAERGGRIVFTMRGAAPVATLSDAELALPEGGAPALAAVRAAPASVPGRVRLTHVAETGDLAASVAEAILLEAALPDVEDLELPLVLTGAEARGIAGRWLAEAATSREELRLGLPMAMASLGAGDVVALATGGHPERRFRIERIEQARGLSVTAARVNALPAAVAATDTPAAPPPRAAVALPVDAVFLDLPLLRGDEAPHAPHVAVAARPWPGPVAIYSGVSADALALDTVVDRAAAVGVLAAPFPAGRPGLWQRGAPLTVRMPWHALSSRPEAEVLAGANLLAVGDGLRWEVLQFGLAELVGSDLWRLDRLLRGQAGTEAEMPQAWDTGSTVVLLDGAPVQIGLAPTQRGQPRHYRFGAAAVPPSDPGFRSTERAFQGFGLRPYAPCHLRARPDGLGGLALRWIRRSRIDGDRWDGEVPLGEAREAYLLRVLVAGTEVRRAEVAEPAWTYAAADRNRDGAAGACVIEVAQLSDVFGPGPARRIEIDG